MCYVYPKIDVESNWEHLGNGYCNVSTGRIQLSSNVQSINDCKLLCKGLCEYVSYQATPNRGFTTKACYGYETCTSQNTVDNYETYKKTNNKGEFENHVVTEYYISIIRYFLFYIWSVLIKLLEISRYLVDTTLPYKSDATTDDKSLKPEVMDEWGNDSSMGPSAITQGSSETKFTQNIFTKSKFTQLNIYLSYRQIFIQIQSLFYSPRQ